jgi:hypothetical protein
LGWVLSDATRASKKNFLFFQPQQSNVNKRDDFFELSAMKVHRLFLLVIPLLFLRGSVINAGPVGDFFKKVGQSISRPSQAEPQPPPQPQPQPKRAQATKTTHATRRSSSRGTPAAATTPGAVAQPSQAPKTGESPATLHRVSAADLEKAKANLPYGIPVPGRQGMVTSPYTPEQANYVDVTGFASGSVVQDPYTGKFFLVP